MKQFRPALSRPVVLVRDHTGCTKRAFPTNRVIARWCVLVHVRRPLSVHLTHLLPLFLHVCRILTVKQLRETRRLEPLWGLSDSICAMIWDVRIYIEVMCNSCNFTLQIRFSQRATRSGHRPHRPARPTPPYRWRPPLPPSIWWRASAPASSCRPRHRKRSKSRRKGATRSVAVWSRKPATVPDRRSKSRPPSIARAWCKRGARGRTRSNGTGSMWRRSRARRVRWPKSPPAGRRWWSSKSRVPRRRSRSPRASLTILLLELMVGLDFCPLLYLIT